jgi:glycosyltransferase 2 family protein
MPTVELQGVIREPARASVMPRSNKLWTGLRVALGLGLLALLISRVDPAEYAALVRAGDPRQLALGLALLFLAFPVLQALRLHPLVARYTQSIAATFVVFMVGAFFNTMLPSNVGGDAVRLLYLKRMRAENWGGPFAMLMLHRAAAMGVLLLAAGIHAALNAPRLARVLAGVELDPRIAAQLRPATLLAVLLALALLSALAWALAGRFRARIATRVRRFAAECWAALRELGWGPAALLLALTALFHFVRMLAFYILIRCTGQSIALFDLLPVLAATALAGVVPLTVGGLGLMEGAISVTLTLFGVAETAAIGAAIANRAVLLVSAAIGGVVYVISGRVDRAAQP